MRTVAIRHIGPYMGIASAFERLGAWAAAHDLVDRQMLGVYYDDPATVPASQLRSDACIEVEPDYPVNDPTVHITIIPSGTYAVATYIGPYDALPQAWGEFYGRWFPASRHVMDTTNSCGSFEKYLNDPTYVPPQHLITELYQAIVT